MKPGPQPEPTHLKIIKGNPGGRPLNDQEPEPNRVEPEELEFVKPDLLQDGEDKERTTMLGAASRMWDALAPELLRLGLLTVVDLHALEAICTSWGLAVEATYTLSREGVVVAEPKLDRSGNIVGESVKKHPAAQIARDNYSAYRTWCQEFGLTPASRPRLRTSQGGEGKGEGEDLLD